MEITEKVLGEITVVFRGVEYGRITFYLSPENKTLNYTVETNHKMPIDRPEQPRTCRIKARSRKT